MDRPTSVEVGQVWKDNDNRSKGTGEFVVVEVSATQNQVFGYAYVRREATGKVTRIRTERLLHDDGPRGYSYIGRSR
jgi:hypothetical protein